MKKGLRGSVQLETWVRELEDAQTQFDETVAVIGDEIRTQVIIPLCRTNKLEFVSGNGDFFFITQDGKNYGEALDAHGTRLERILKPIFELLNLEVYHNNHMGFHVDDVRKKDYSS